LEKTPSGDHLPVHGVGRENDENSLTNDVDKMVRAKGDLAGVLKTHGGEAEAVGEVDVDEGLIPHSPLGPQFLTLEVLDQDFILVLGEFLEVLKLVQQLDVQDRLLHRRVQAGPVVPGPLGMGK